MKILDRYIAATFLKNFALAVMALTGLYVFQALLGELLDHEFQTRQIVLYNLLKIPDIWVQMTPPAILLATVLTLSGFNRSNELVACYSIGIGILRIMAVIVSLVFMVSCFTLILQDRILPPVFKKRTVYYQRVMKKKTDFFMDFKQDKIWYRSKNLIYNLKTFDLKGRTIIGMSVYAFDENFKLIQVMEAEKGIYTPQGWKLSNGTITVFSSKDGFPLTTKFVEKNLMINESPTDFQEIEKEVNALRLKELSQYIKKTKQAGTDTKAFEIKLHSKISLSFIPLVMCILGVPFSIRNRREGGLARDLSMCLVVTFFYWLFYSISLSLGTNGTLTPILAAWLPSFIFAFIAILLILRKKI